MTVEVSVVMTVRHEPPARLRRVLAALAAQKGLDAPFEVVVAAPPNEATASPALAARGAVGRVVVVENPGGDRSSGLNRAVAAAAGTYVCRVDARSRPGHRYIASCVARLRADPRVGVVGAVQRPVAGGTGVTATAVARALSNPWALGGAAYRRRSASGPVDTVYLGAFRRRELLALGGYDVRLEANEDYELCRRYRRRGLTVWLEPGLEVDYEARTTLGDLWRQYHAFGRSKVRFWRATGSAPDRRQWLALAGAGLATVGTAVALARPPWLAAAAAAAAASMAVVDHAAVPADDRPAVRAVALVAYVTVVVGWVSGVAAELAVRRDPVPAPVTA